MCGYYGDLSYVCVNWVGSGIWIDEEWPRFMDQPWRADSLNDLWGKRYHQVSPFRMIIVKS